MAKKKEAEETQVQEPVEQAEQPAVAEEPAVEPVEEKAQAETEQVNEQVESVFDEAQRKGYFGGRPNKVEGGE